MKRRFESPTPESPRDTGRQSPGPQERKLTLQERRDREYMFTSNPSDHPSPIQGDQPSSTQEPERRPVKRRRVEEHLDGDQQSRDAICNSLHAVRKLIVT